MGKCHMKLDEDLNKKENEWSVEVEATKDFLNNLDKIIESMVIDDDSWKEMVKRTDTPKFIYSNECVSSRLAYENAKLKDKIKDLEETLEIASLLGTEFMKETHILMKLIRESGHDEIIDKFHEMQKEELVKKGEK